MLTRKTIDVIRMTGLMNFLFIAENKWHIAALRRENVLCAIMLTFARWLCVCVIQNKKINTKHGWFAGWNVDVYSHDQI